MLRFQTICSTRPVAEFPFFRKNAVHARAVHARAEIAPVAAEWVWMVKSIRGLRLVRENFY